jgi:superfamily I DNA and/or RNA helicase
MIGDHKQLPPFGSDQMVELLSYPNQVKEVLTLGEEFVGRSLRDATTDEIIDEVEEESEPDQESLPALCSEAIRMLLLFENMIESEFNRQRKSSKGRPIAKKLTQQHRMHPDIASIVSRCFYDGTLTSHADCVARYEKEPHRFESLDTARLPNTPVVVIDMPYVQSEIGQKQGDRFPRWHNPAEVDAVVEVVSLLKAKPSGEKSQKASLAILSPYRQQVTRLDEAVREVPTAAGFTPATHNGVWCHTVDSFQGGEADVVVTSLVRNNGERTRFSERQTTDERIAQ